MKFEKMDTSSVIDEKAENTNHTKVKAVQHIAYRPEIDGLRAIAILSVLAFHAFPKNLRGGFVGVDIFFVISGFLISSIIFKALDDKKFSFSDFYIRRVKRIFPALILVVSACFVAGWFSLLSEEFQMLGKHIVTGLGFFQNIELYKEAGYFDTSSEVKPLMHLWSLGVEEQFYLLFPVLALCIWRLGLNAITMVSIAAASSFFFGVGIIKSDPVASFFLPQYRFWELMAGSAVSYVTLYKRSAFIETIGAAVFSKLLFSNPPPQEKRRQVISEILSIVGLALLITSVVTIHSGRMFPGWWALLPVSGAALIILADGSTWVNRKILASRPMVAVGLISYPLYLWHWPILSFAHIVEGGIPSQEVRVVAVFVSIVLAWATYRFLELPIRRNTNSKKIVTLLVALALVAGSAGSYVWWMGGLSFRLNDRESYARYFENSPPQWQYFTSHGIPEKYRDQCNFYDMSKFLDGKATQAPVKKLSDECVVSNTQEKIFLWGDSHAQHLYYGLRESLPKDISILQVASSMCAPNVPGQTTGAPEYCNKSNEVAYATIQKEKPSVVLLAQLSGLDDVNNLIEITEKLKGLGVDRVIVVGPIPRYTASLYQLISRKYWVHTPRRMKENLVEDVFKKDESMKEKYSKGQGGFEYFSMADLFCNSDGCLTYIGDNRREGLVTYDYGHFTPETSIFVAKQALANLVLKSFPQVQVQETAR